MTYTAVRDHDEAERLKGASERRRVGGAVTDRLERWRADRVLAAHDLLPGVLDHDRHAIPARIIAGSFGGDTS